MKGEAHKGAVLGKLTWVGLSCLCRDYSEVRVRDGPVWCFGVQALSCLLIKSCAKWKSLDIKEHSARRTWDKWELGTDAGGEEKWKGAKEMVKLLLLWCRVCSSGGGSHDCRLSMGTIGVHKLFQLFNHGGTGRGILFVYSSEVRNFSWKVRSGGGGFHPAKRKKQMSCVTDRVRGFVSSSTLSDRRCRQLLKGSGLSGFYLKAFEDQKSFCSSAKQG